MLEELQALARVEAVSGNMDDAALRAELPQTHVLELEEIRIGLVHIPGPRAGREDRLTQRFPGCTAVIYGHTHVPEVARHGEVWLLNPGSPTERRRAPTHTMIRLVVEGPTIVPELVEVG